MLIISREVKAVTCIVRKRPRPIGPTSAKQVTGNSRTLATSYTPPVTANSRSGGGAIAMQIFEEKRNPASRMAWKTDCAVEKLPVRIALGRCPVQLLI